MEVTNFYLADGFAENFNAVTGEPLRDRANSQTAAVYMLLSASR